MEGGAGKGGVAYDFLRRGFVRKVFGLLAAQLLLTAAIAAPMVLVPSVTAFVAANGWIVGVSSIASLALILVLSFSESARHTHPTNLLLLAAFTALEGVVVGAIAASYALSSVALAVFITGGVAGALSVYATRTKTDYTAQGGMLLSALTAIILTGLIGMFTRSSAFELMVAGGGALLFGFYIVFDVQLLVGGQHAQFQLSPDDYVPGAIALYLDVVNLFIYILRLVGSERE
jgi:FtsH-binding integral membrane protein